MFTHVIDISLGNGVFNFHNETNENMIFPEYPVCTTWLFTFLPGENTFIYKIGSTIYKLIHPIPKLPLNDNMCTGIYKPLAPTKDSSDSVGAFTETGFNYRVRILARTADSSSESWTGWTGS